LFKVVKSRSLSNIGLWYSEHTSLVLDTDYSTVIAYKSDQGTETATINHSVSFIVSSEKTPSKRMYVGFETNICSDGDRAGYWTELQQKKQKKGQKPGLAIRLLRGRYDAGRGYCNKNISVGFENYGCPKQYLKTIGHLLEGSPEACTESLSLAFKHIEFLLKSPKVLQQKIQQLQQLRLEQTAGLLDKLKQLGGKLHE
jgi:hypothetical protein